jgi:hypothetical protein
MKCEVVHTSKKIYLSLEFHIDMRFGQPWNRRDEPALTACMTTTADSAQLDLQGEITRIDRAIAETAKYAGRLFKVG